MNVGRTFRSDSNGGQKCPSYEGRLRDLAGIDWDAIVIGAGPAGSVAARQIALAGRRVLLLDKKSFPRRKVCGACLNQSSLSALERMGLGAALRSLHAPELNRFELRAGSRRTSLLLPSGVAVSRATLDSLLANEAVRAGAIFCDEVTATVGEVLDQRRVVSVRESSARGGDSLRAKVVLAADGLGHPSGAGFLPVRIQQGDDHAPVEIQDHGRVANLPHEVADFPAK